MAAKPGKRGRVTIGTVQQTVRHIFAKEFTVDNSGEDLDTTNFESGGFDEGVLGIELLAFAFKGDWRPERNYLMNPPGLFPRDDLANVKLFPSTDDLANFWDIPCARVLKAHQTCPVKGVVSFDVDLKSNGKFVRPGEKAEKTGCNEKDIN